MTSTNWKADLYDYKHGFVSEYGTELLQLLAPKEGEAILDLGCGTGDLAFSISKAGAKVVGLDFSPSMIRQATNKYPTIPFNVADGENFTWGEPFDAVFSNAALHWMKRPKNVLECVSNILRPGGRFVAEFGGKGNVQSIVEALIESIKDGGFSFNRDRIPWYFPSIAEYTALMEQRGFYVQFAHHFERPTALEGKQGMVHWIDMFAGSFFEGIPSENHEEIIEKTTQKLRSELFIDGTWFADYKRIRVIGVKTK
jgi:trans-aconitate methyltransferase